MPSDAQKNAARIREPYSTVWLCPFCGDDIVVVKTLAYDPDAVDEELRSHIHERHPLRRRLNRKMRLAFRASEHRCG